MKKTVITILTAVSLLFSMTGCNKTETVEAAPTSGTTISGSFTVSVWDVIPDHCLDNITPTVALVSEFQSYPFTIYIGEELGKELKSQDLSNPYVFTIEPVSTEYSIEELKKLHLSSLAWDITDFNVTDIRPATEEECGLSSLQLTFTENK